MSNGFDLTQIHAGLCTPEFRIKLDPVSVRLFHNSIGWKEDAGISPTLPVTFWQAMYPEWLSTCTLPQILREQSVRYYESLQFHQEYDCRIECTHVSYQETKSGNTFLSLTHRLSGERLGKRVWDADTVLYIPATVPEGIVANKAVPTVPQPTNRVCIGEEKITADQIRQYAYASGDRQAIHLDEQVAKAAGYPHLLVHGMFGIGLSLSRYAQNFAYGETLQQIRAQFVGPLFAGETLICYTSSTDDQHQLFGFEKGKGKLAFIVDFQNAR